MKIECVCLISSSLVWLTGIVLNVLYTKASRNGRLARWILDHLWVEMLSQYLIVVGLGAVILSVVATASK